MATDSGSGLSDVSEPGGTTPKDEDISADVDRMMGKISELRKLTSSSLEVDVERANHVESGDQDSPALSTGTSDFRRCFIRTQRKRRGSTGSAGLAKEEQPRQTITRHRSVESLLNTPQKPRGRSSSITVLEGLEAVLQQFQYLGGDAASEAMGSDSGAEGDAEGVLHYLQDRLANLEKEVRVWSGHLQESEVRIRTEVFTKLEQAIEAELHTRCEALESQVLARLPSLQPASPQASVPPSPSRALPGLSVEDTAKNAKEKQPDTGRAEELALLKVATGGISDLRQEVSEMEERMRTYLKAETQARVGGHQLLMREIEKEAKARLFDGVSVRKMIGSPSSGAIQGVPCISPVSSDGTRTNRRLVSPGKNNAASQFEHGRVAESPQTCLARKGEVDVQLGNIASHCAWIAETLSSNVDEEPVRTRVIHLSHDLEKVATYLSGSLQLQLESMTEVICFIQEELDTIARVSPLPKTAISSKTSTIISSPSMIAPKLSTVTSCPLPKSSAAGRVPVLSSMARTFSAVEVQMPQPRSVLTQGVEEVCLGTPRSVLKSAVPVVAPPKHSHPNQNQVSPTTPPSFAPSLNAMGPRTPSAGGGCGSPAPGGTLGPGGAHNDPHATVNVMSNQGSPNRGGNNKLNCDHHHDCWMGS